MRTDREGYAIVTKSKAGSGAAKAIGVAIVTCKRRCSMKVRRFDGESEMGE